MLYLAGRFLVVKASLVLSKEEVLGLVLDLSLGDGEVRGDVFGGDLNLAA